MVQGSRSPVLDAACVGVTLSLAVGWRGLSDLTTQSLAVSAEQVGTTVLPDAVTAALPDATDAQLHSTRKQTTAQKSLLMYSLTWAELRRNQATRHYTSPRSLKGTLFENGATCSRSNPTPQPNI
jgi:hypothetical protein